MNATVFYSLIYKTRDSEIKFIKHVKLMNIQILNRRVARIFLGQGTFLGIRAP